MPAAGGAYYTINVSPQHFRSPKLARRLLDMIARHGVAPQRLRVEITESAVLEDPDLVLRTLNDLREAGVLAVFDDFGTGYSSPKASKPASSRMRCWRWDAPTGRVSCSRLRVRRRAGKSDGCGQVGS